MSESEPRLPILHRAALFLLRLWARLRSLFRRPATIYADSRRRAFYGVHRGQLVRLDKRHGPKKQRRELRRLREKAQRVKQSLAQVQALRQKVGGAGKPPVPKLPPNLIVKCGQQPPRPSGVSN